MPAEGSPFSATTRVLEIDVPDDRAAVVAEALRELVGRLPRHATIVPVLDAGIADGRPYIAIPTCDAEPLDAALKVYGPAAIDDALPRLEHLADALDVAAADGLCHGALCPADVLVSADDTRLVGLGVVQVLRRHGVETPVDAAYAAPEAIHGEVPTPQADQFALALIAHEWLFGARWVPGTFGPDAPALRGVDQESLQRAFATATADDPSGRFPTCRAFVDAIAASVAPRQAPITKVLEFTPVADELPLQPAAVAEPELLVPTPPPPAPSAVTSTSRFGAPALVAALLFGAALGAVAMWVYSQSLVAPESHDAFERTTDATAADSETREAREVTEEEIVAPRDDQPERASVAVDPPDRPADVQVEAGLLIHSTPAGALVTVDGVMQGRTPVAVRGLPLGTRTVTLTRPGFRNVVREVRLTAERPSRALEITMTPVTPAVSPVSATASVDGVLVVESRPAGAQVFVDERAVGVTPLTMTVAPGAHTVRMEQAGYRTVSTRVEVKAGERARVAARLEGGPNEE